MRKLVFWCLFPFVIVFVILTLILSVAMDLFERVNRFLQLFVKFGFSRIYILENWAYRLEDKK